MTKSSTAMTTATYYIPDPCSAEDDTDIHGGGIDMYARRPSLLTYIGFNTALGPIIENSDDEGDESDNEAESSSRSNSVQSFEKEQNNKSDGGLLQKIFKKNKKNRNSKRYQDFQEKLKDKSSNGTIECVCKEEDKIIGRVDGCLCSVSKTGSKNSPGSKNSLCVKDSSDGKLALRGDKISNGHSKYNDNKNLLTVPSHAHQNGHLPGKNGDLLSCDRLRPPNTKHQQLPLDTCVVYEVGSSPNGSTRLSDHAMFVPEDEFKEKFVGKKLVKLVGVMALGFVLVGGIVAWVFSPAIF